MISSALVTIIFGFLILGLLVFLLVFFLRQETKQAKNQTNNVAILQQQVNSVLELFQKQLSEVQQVVDSRLSSMSGTLTEQLSGSSKIIGDIRGQLGGLEKAAKNMEDLGKDIASLQDILRAPKLRGNLGELFLEEMLRQVMPKESYEMQYRLPGKDRSSYVTVDAVIKLQGRIVPIDSKFPLESFQRLMSTEGEGEKVKARKVFLDAVKVQIVQIAEKYIQPESNTYDFAIMYLPAENVYYEAFIRNDDVQNILSFAAKNKVIPVSPNTFYAYLLTIVYGLKGLQIERQAEAIRGELSDFQKKFLKFYDEFKLIGKNLSLAQKHFEDSEKRAEKLNEQTGKITGNVLELGAGDEERLGKA